MAGRTRNRSDTEQITITVPKQTFAYLVKLAAVGAMGAHEAMIASVIVVNEVERLMAARRAETVLATVPSSSPPEDDSAP
jgi:hypothetical protein